MEKHDRSDTGALSPDRRGRHEPKNKLTALDIEGIEQHIAQFPKVPSHYCRRDSRKIYLEGTLNKTVMHEAYNAYAAENNLRLVSQPVYIKQLERLNIAFHQPRKDKCWCADFGQWTQDEQNLNQAKYDAHIVRKEAARQEKIKDTTDASKNSRVMTVCFDLEANLYSPFLSSKPFFYKLKLASYNFTVSDCSSKKGTFRLIAITF